MAIKVAGQEVISDERKITGAIGLDLTPIEATIADSAVDVFVYDTRKDSDGGAWRKRTQHTSWYNETLNTATRGSRKEFPAVAVIVAEATQVTIYDGDDPDLPMWMVFNGSIYDMLGTTSVNINSGIYALNAKLGVTNSAYGVSIVDFIKDDAFKYRDNVARTLSGYYKGSILERNDSNNYDGTDPYGIIVNDDNNDIAMTVLPNAPIDPATQLPIPTIAVATDGGVSVIKDDGSVVDIVGTSQGSDAVVDSISFVGFDKVAYSHRYATEVNTIPSSDDSSAYYNTTATWVGRITNSNSHISTQQVSALADAAGNMESIAIDADNAVSKSTSGLSRAINFAISGNAERASCFITSTYNTGWMNGDIKLATLSDTDDTDVTGSELVTNGTFDSDVSGWSGDGTSLVSWTSNGIYVQRNGSGTASGRTTGRQVISGLTVGERYVLTAEVISLSDNVSIDIYDSGFNTPVTSDQDTLTSTTGVLAVTFTANATSQGVALGCRNSVSASATIDNISIRLAEEDRSVNGNGLQVFGTVTKTPVATGADLVAYSGFSTSNYLEQPYNSDLDFGTGDFCVMGWVKTTDVTGYPYFINRSDGSTGYRFYIMPDGTCRFVINSSVAVTPSSVATGNWVFICGVRSNGVAYIYQDGKQVHSATATGDVDSVFNTRIGNSYDGLNPLDGSLALWRISATAPTAEQIKTIYESEKHLFTEGAQATLYGTSDAVTALAYDDDTEILSVGTSSGRSDFSGLRRVNNTTTAVTTAISASNSLIVEQ